MPVTSTIKKYRKTQIGKEVTPGTEVAATRILRLLNASWNDYASWQKYVPEYDIGRLSLTPEVGEITRKGMTARFETDLTFEDILFPLLFGFKGGVTPTEQTVGEGDQLWTFQNAPTLADPAQESATIEQRFSNGTTHYDRTSTFMMLSQFEISADQGGDASKITMELFGRTSNDNAITGALTLPTPFDLIAALDWALYVDDTWGGLGGTQIQSAMRSFTFRYMTGLSPALYIGDGRLDMADVRLGPRGAELEMTWENGASMDTELGKFESNAKRFIRLEATGDQIGAGENKRVRIDGAYQYDNIGEPGEADGNDTRTLSLRTVADDDSNDLLVEVLNSLTAYP